ncbi:hypothetical protein VPH219E481_0017 [Vibrio phage 219E48-1]|nr:hypothetical protein PODOV021v1_p0004 [Vibrio phage 219E41.2]QZI91038.1 hypothetical protein PODOV032v1_p0033 [Vibrio phage 219E41.1]QZI91145.1 hypothetical protein PODOV060v1_p0051 [Vibrio phage 234P8]QZI91562.1 hypothetical protein PODOV087v1_p0057 [Vibrio phage 431E45.1]QZI91654.1 hypothetical protein PODOV086v1_p0070 [Vibrio phage 431E46.1]QZI91687.1 hypothetical protein PODOV088v1_p0026 [Vibrio phage 431E48.2]
MGYEPRDTTGGGSSESRESTEGNRETRDREKRGRDRDRSGSGETTTPEVEQTTSNAPEQDQGQGQGQDQGQNQSQSRRSVDNTEVENTRSFLGRIRDIFSSDDDEGDKMTDQQGNVVAESFTIDRPAEIQTVNLGEKTDYETIDSDNPVESYARSVIDDGLVGGEQKEKDLVSDIADAGRLAQAADVASTFGSVIAGPVGAVPGLAHDVITGLQDDDVQKAGESLYEGGKVNVPGASTAIGSVFGSVAGSAFDVANEVFGGSSQLGAFEDAAGIDRDPITTSPTGGDFGADNNRPSTSTVTTSQPLAEPPATLASTFSTSSLGTNVYSDFLDNFFKQG